MTTAISVSMEDDHLIPLMEGNIPVSFGVLLEGGPMTFKKDWTTFSCVRGTKYNNLLPKIEICCIMLPSKRPPNLIL